jgi:hypothetical protein
MTISMHMVTEETLEECKRHVDECVALLERPLFRSIAKP